MWEAILKDGSFVEEKSAKWGDVKENIQQLSFRYHGVLFELPKNQKEYRQAKTASAPISSHPSQAEVESRWIGFSPNGVNFITLRFMEKEKKVTVVFDEK
jgi:hypothetical protein